ncbi:hypothetical protein BKA70DRAFT_1289768 [Coprinopsis sp. MPI-PUGE-AT-0042]|nr:hypothetical protein BKA70DRAFT_1289768 [Coprinopsis sp. MPI-PUGE-AT-0042]
MKFAPAFTLVLSQLIALAPFVAAQVCSGGRKEVCCDSVTALNLVGNDCSFTSEGCTPGLAHACCRSLSIVGQAVDCVVIAE